MLRPDALQPAEVAEAEKSAPGRAVQTLVRQRPQVSETILRRRAKRQGLLLLIASSVVMIGLVAGLWMVLG